jgi:hypothetical protein
MNDSRRRVGNGGKQVSLQVADARQPIGPEPQA